MSNVPLRCFVLLCGLFLLAGCASHHSHAPPPNSPDPNTLPLSGVTVVLDPGHGGEDCGARVNGVTEASLTYRTAAAVAARLREQGARVVFTVKSSALLVPIGASEPVLTEPTDAVIVSTEQPIKTRNSPRPLWARAATGAREWKRQGGQDVLFLSLHYDDFHQKNVRGGLVCVDRRRPMPLLARALCEQFTRANLGRPRSVLHDLSPLVQGRFGVLDPDYNPVPESALLEVATLSNPADCACALDPLWRQAVAGFVTRAVMAAHEKTPPRLRHPSP